MGDRTFEKWSRKSEDNGRMDDMINGLLVDTQCILHTHHLHCTPPHCTGGHPHECMQCNFASPPQKGASLSANLVNESRLLKIYSQQRAKFPGRAIHRNWQLRRVLGSCCISIDTFSDSQLYIAGTFSVWQVFRTLYDFPMLC